MKRLHKYIISLVITFVVTAAPAANVDISVDPSSSSVDLGDNFSVDILGYYGDSGNLLSGSLNLIFDPLVLDVTGVTIVAPDDIGSGFGSGTIDNISGRVDLIGFLDFFGVTGDFTLATINFTAVGAGVNSILQLEDANDPFLAWVNDVPPYDELVIPSFTNGYVTVTASAVPIPAGIWLLASGFGMLGMFRRRKS